MFHTKDDGRPSPDILIEALEVFLNHLLYVREVYPAQIFKKRCIYNTPIYVSIYPPLNSYLFKVLSAARELHRKGELECVEVVLFGSEEATYERYTFRFSSLISKESTAEDLQQQQQQLKDDEFLLEFEEQLRASLYGLAERLKPFGKLPGDTKFKILLHTTQTGFVRLSHDAHYQDFPWLRTNTLKKQSCHETSLLPLTTLQSVGLELVAEVD